MNGNSMSSGRERDLVKEAQGIIDRYALTLRRTNRRKKARRKKSFPEKSLWFVAGITASVAFFLAVFLKIY